ncbi:MAG: DUF2842 domain-containing protein [Bauldia sp.]
MDIRTRKLIGAVGLLLFVGAYALIVVALASSQLMNLSMGWLLVFYAACGLLWVPPAALIIRWMEKPNREARRAAARPAGTPSR